MRKAVYPGSFDPPTYGHLDIIERASQLFDELIVAVGVNPRKQVMLSTEERMALLNKLTEGLPNVRVESFDGMAVSFVRSQRSKIIIRGIRTVSDFEYEFQMALSNQNLARDIETVFIMSSQQYSYFSASIIKEVLTLGGNISSFVPGIVEEMMRKKLKKAEDGS